MSDTSTQTIADALLLLSLGERNEIGKDAAERLMKLERENAALRAALVEIRKLKPINMACDYWNKQLGLEPDDVFDICDAALDAARKETKP